MNGNVCRALPVYLPVYLFPALLVHRKRLLDPKLAPDIGRRAALGAVRSSLFLSLYCTLAWRGACVGFQHSSESNLLCAVCMLCLMSQHSSRVIMLQFEAQAANGVSGCDAQLHADQVAINALAAGLCTKACHVSL